jgi:hypothetical protein
MTPRLDYKEGCICDTCEAYSSGRQAGDAEGFKRAVAASALAICAYCRNGVPLDGRAHRSPNGLFVGLCAADSIRQLAPQGKP